MDWGGVLVEVPGGVGFDGNSWGIMPRSAHVAKLRYSFVADGLKYSIWRVSLPDGIRIRIRAAPCMGRFVPEADRIWRFTGMRSSGDRWSWFIRVGPARQLWHPVSAMAVVCRLWVSRGRVCP